MISCDPSLTFSLAASRGGHCDPNAANRINPMMASANSPGAEEAGESYTSLRQGSGPREKSSRRRELSSGSYIKFSRPESSRLELDGRSDRQQPSSRRLASSPHRLSVRTNQNTWDNSRVSNPSPLPPLFHTHTNTPFEIEKFLGNTFSLGTQATSCGLPSIT